MAKNNKKIFRKVEELIEENKKNSVSKNDGVFILSVYKKGEKAKVKALVNGINPDELDVIVRELYGNIYAQRKRNSKKMKEINKKLKKR